jgi:hypothetical protein
MQSLLTNGNFNFACGQSGAYLSTDTAANYLPSNNVNDNVGPTRSFTKHNNYIYTCTSQGAFRSADNDSLRKVVVLLCFQPSLRSSNAIIGLNY